MGDHNAASIVGQAAGLGGSAVPRPDHISPEQLIEAFCNESAAGLVADPGVSESDGVRTGRGWCGYRGGRGDSIAVGFDDGYDFLGYLSERGWRPLASKGDWPYVVYMVAAFDGGYAVAEYCETDLTMTILPTRHQLETFCGELRDAP
ncbi:MAG TPA: hypothetical protein VH299_14635 [Solirubrobacterales bacterium]|jgi:hypothetical protein|nr:hypothetical protein [Solirubrobacterales bacterium]